MKDRYKGLFTVSIYKDHDTEAQKTIDFPLTEEGVKQALDLAREFLDWQRRKRMIKPFVVPKPKDGGIVPAWLIKELTFRDDYKDIRVDKKVLEAVFTELREKGLLKYATEFAAERRKEDE